MIQCFPDRLKFLLLSAALVGILQADSLNAWAQPSAMNLERRVQALTSAQLAGRGAGTAEAAATVALLTQWLKEMGLQPGFKEEWAQAFPLKGESWIGEDLTGKQGHNLAGIVPGRGHLADRYIVIGAHLDHLGRVEGVDSESIPGADGYYPGANDNASGLTVLCELASLAEAQPRPASCRSLLFICFGAEEVGLQGSAYLVAHPPVPLDQIDAMINLDTVGQLEDDRLYVSGLGTAAELPDLVAAANTDHLDLNLAQGGWSGSDHMSFNTREVPVIFLFGGAYRQYNTPGDTWDTLNYDGLVKVSAYANRLVQSLQVIDGPLTWVMVAEKSLGENDDTAQNRDSWLGTLPDFTEDIKGYKLAGVFDDSPAAQAGLMKGDVLVFMAGQEVTDLATFTRALRSSGPGDLVEIRVLRGGKPLNFTIVLGDRKNRK